jgi:hypothetical protein
MPKRATKPRRVSKRPRKTGIIKKLAPKSAPLHPDPEKAEEGVACIYHVEYQENGEHVDSATYASVEECEDWLWTLYKIEATDGTV